MAKPYAPGEPTLAHMIHQSYLLTWLVRTLGLTIGLFLAPPVVGGIVALRTGDEFWWFIGALAGLVLPPFYLQTATAPLPTDEMVTLLGPDSPSEASD